MIKLCEICGTYFTTTYGQKYCSEECRREAKRRQRQARDGAAKLQNIHEKTCAYCGETFYTMQGNKKFCSEDCQCAYLRGESISMFERRGYRRSKEYKEWAKAYNRCPDDPKRFDRKLEQLKEKGISYADYQKQQTLERYGKIK